MDASRANSRPNPRAKAGAISVLLWWWTVKLFKKGYTKVLSIDDLYDPLKKDKSTLLGDRLEKQWEIQLTKAKKLKKEPSLLKTIAITFRKEIFFLGIIHVIIEFVFRLGSPILLGYLLQYFKPETTTTQENALLYAGALSFNNFLTFISANHLLFQAYYLGGRIRVAVCSVVYRKALKLSKTSLGETAPGKIVNLVANDVNRFDLVMILLHNMWTAPLTTLIIACILYREAHVSALIGIAVLLSMVPIQVYAGKLSSKYRLETAIKTDERVRLMDEIISGVQVIKMYAWEKPFCALVGLARKFELKIVRKTSHLRGLFMTFFLFTTRAALYCTLVSMLHYGEPLTADKIFVFASFYTILANSMATMFARGFAEIAECIVSVARIQSFMLLDEFRTGNVTNADEDAHGKRNSLIIKEVENGMAIGDTTEGKRRNVSEISDAWSVSIENVTAKWLPESSDNTLENINLRLEKGKLYVVIGMVGSGKSSLLSAILGEINLVEGRIKVRGDVSYVSQDAWVFNSSVRQNILFGQEFDRHKYQQVVKACSLYKDFAQFPQGDHTIVGERGSSLSGGQKARVNLARAVYRKSDVYLLDDPLSAVDAHVGKHLFDECIRRYLRGKTRILATHQLQFVKDVDGIILLDQGKMQYYSDYHELLQAYPEYNSLIAADKEDDASKDVTVNKAELRRRFSSTGSKSRVSESGDVEIVDENDDSQNLEDTMETTSKGVVKGNVFMQYFQSGSNICITFIMIVLFLVTQLFVSLNDLAVPLIVNAEELRSFYESQKNETNPQKEETAMLAKEDLYPTEYYVYAYTFIIIGIFVIGITRALIYYILCLSSSERLHNSAFAAIIRTNLRFFDTNPSGRILNRFSKDTAAMDELLPKAMLDAAQIVLMMAGAVVLTCLVNPIFIVPVFIIGVICFWIKKVYIKTSKNIKRLEGITRSPVFTHLSATLNGISTIRAYRAESILKLEFDKFQDVHTSAWYIFTACSLAYAFALDVFTFSFITSITFSFVFFREHFNGGEVGLAITQMMSIANLVQWGMRQSAEVTNQMTSVERILEYTQLPPENNLRDADETTKGKKIRIKGQKTLSAQFLIPPKEWPSKGTVEFKNVFMRYAANEEPVLKDLNFYINPSEKVGIVGRTGAGKSSLISALFRLASLEGVIEIDKVDTGKIALEDLRSRISIIPQDPVLFSGTLRRNLDPFEEFPDKDLWEALEEVELKDAIMASGVGLNCRVLDRGSNFSVGQRQLVCLARAVLRNNRVLMLDEATANVDPQTDALIQKTIRTKFASCTVLTVAHRLNTIIDSDKVIVMDKGRLVEFDHPYVLLKNENGVFNSLVKETGDAMFQQLFELSKKCYQENCHRL